MFLRLTTRLRKVSQGCDFLPRPYWAEVRALNSKSRVQHHSCSKNANRKTMRTSVQLAIFRLDRMYVIAYK